MFAWQLLTRATKVSQCAEHPVCRIGWHVPAHNRFFGIVQLWLRLKSRFRRTHNARGTLETAMLHASRPRVCTAYTESPKRWGVRECECEYERSTPETDRRSVLSRLNCRLPRFRITDDIPTNAFTETPFPSSSTHLSLSLSFCVCLSLSSSPYKQARESWWIDRGSRRRSTREAPGRQGERFD